MPVSTQIPECSIREESNIEPTAALRCDMKIRPLALALLTLFLPPLFGQTTNINVDSILATPLQAPEVTLLELRQYGMARVPKLAVPATAQQWTAEASRLRKHILEDVVFHGWPAEWVNSPPRFEDLGLILGPLVLGVVYSTLGPWNLFPTAAILAVVAMILALLAQGSPSVGKPAPMPE